VGGSPDIDHAILAVLILTNPMCYFVSAASYRSGRNRRSTTRRCPLSIPVTTFFPYANAGELFVWLGIASGLQQLGVSTVPLALALPAGRRPSDHLRGLVTEWITALIIRRTGQTELFRRLRPGVPVPGLAATA